MRSGLTILIALVVFGTGCATQLAVPEVSEEAFLREQSKQHELILKIRWERQRRLLDVAGAVRVAGKVECGDDVAPVYGLLAGRAEDFDPDWRRLARRVIGVSNKLTVWHVSPNLPAHRAGLLHRDVITKVNGVRVASTQELAEQLQVGGMVVPFEIERGGRRYVARLKPAPGCRYPAELVEAPGVNAFAYGERVLVTQGMMRFVESDSELALVVGHEIAHNVLDHLGRRSVNQAAGMVMGGLLDITAALAGIDTGGAGMRAGGNAGAKAFSQGFEKEADYMGVYIAARAGYRVANAADFWRRMAIEYPGSVEHNHMASHPSTPERSVGIERTVREIERKRKRGLALVPTRKNVPAAQAD